MTTRGGQSHVAHSGFNDLITLVASTPSRLGANLASNSQLFVNPPVSTASNLRRRSKSPSPAATGAYDPLIPTVDTGYVEVPRVDREGARGFPSARGGRARGSARGGGRTGAGGREEWKAVELRKRKVDKRLIGPPKDFRHIFHASTYEEATELLLRWSIEGVGDKLGDPAWAYPIKELVKARAREQQARAVAAVIEATARSRVLGDVAMKDLPPPGTLRVINGLPSSIYSTTDTTLAPVPAAHGVATNGKSITSISPLMLNGSTPNLIANFPSGYFDSASTSNNGLQTPTSPLANPFASPAGTPRPRDPASPLFEISNTRQTQPLQIRKKNSAPPVVAGLGARDGGEEILAKRASRSPEQRDPPTPNTPSRRDVRLAAQDIFAPLPFRVIKPSLPTLEKAMSIALFFEQYYHALLKPPSVNPAKPSSKPVHPGNYVLSRARRVAQLEATFALPENRFMSEAEKKARRDELGREENRILRERRKKVDVKGFELGRVIGHGAFGVVRIAREKETGRLVAMKQLRKADMLRKSQEGHVKAEKDLLAAAASRSLSSTGDTPSWIVQLFYAFQDVDHLYLVLEYMGGGDLLNLLVERDTFDERMTRFYLAEMVLALEETHSLGYVHRDIKPDNFLFTPSGHIRVSDFGLATDLHWVHDTNYYEAQRKAMLRKHGVDLDEASISGANTKTKRMRKEDVERIMGKEWLQQGKGVLTWRDKNRKQMAYSVCGTNSYMAPEVIRGQGYGFSCDWWSLGIIMYESLYGYPPFVSSSRHVTRQKILNWKQSLKFPTKPRLSAECTDLMVKLLCEPEDRLGCTPAERVSVLTSKSATSGGTMRGFVGLGSDGAEAIKRHPWFKGIDWDNLHNMTPPYHPDLFAEDDTRHFDEDIPDEPLAPANGAAGDATKDPLLGHKTHGAHLLEIRKDLAFKGWTFKSPNLEKRYGHMDRIASGGNASHMRDSSDNTMMGGKDDERFGMIEVGEGIGARSTVRSRALSL